MMSNWRFNNLKEIEHTSGYKLSLISGRWDSPTEIRPNLQKSLVLNAIDMARYMREGLEYAGKNVSANT